MSPFTEIAVGAGQMCESVETVVLVNIYIPTNADFGRFPLHRNTIWRFFFKV